MNTEPAQLIPVAGPLSNPELGRAAVDEVLSLGDRVGESLLVLPCDAEARQLPGLCRS